MTELVYVKKEREWNQDVSNDLAEVQEFDRDCDVSIDYVRIKEEWECTSKELEGVMEERVRDCGVSVECVRIIDEREWSGNNDVACIKELPELHATSNDVLCVKTEDECVMEKWEGDEMEGVEMGLYVEHSVKRELVLGPEKLQPQDIAVTLNACNTAVKVKLEPTPITTLFPREAPFLTASSEELSFRTCFVRLQRIDDMLTYNQKSSIGIHRLNNDIKIERIIEKAYSCDTCGEQFEFRTNLIQHVKKQTCSLEYHTKHGSQTSKRLKKDSLKNKTNQPKKRLFVCDYCGKQFWLRQAIATHLRTHTGEKPFSCQNCSKKFTDLSTLIRHKRVHTGEKPYSCDTCNKKFSEKYLLRNHKRIHTGETRYACKFCVRRFNHISNLARHERSHTEKPFVCDICNKRFTLENRLNNHLLTHLEEKPFKCSVCAKSFKQSSHLSRHLQSHVGKPYLCGVCKAGFSQRGALQRHQRRHVCRTTNSELIELKNCSPRIMDPCWTGTRGRYGLHHLQD